jgi:hypothetical protein
MWRASRTLYTRRWPAVCAAGITTLSAAVYYHRQRQESLQHTPQSSTTSTHNTSTSTLWERIRTASEVNFGRVLNAVYADAPKDVAPVPSDWRPPERHVMVDRLKQSKEAPFDLLIIGGGATGSGIVLDAALRGLNVALVEREDFAAGKCDIRYLIIKSNYCMNE